MKYAVSYAPIAQEIQVGRLNKAQTLFLDDKEYCTPDALRAVCELVIDKFDGAVVTGINSKKYRIRVEELS